MDIWHIDRPGIDFRETHDQEACRLAAVVHQLMAAHWANRATQCRDAGDNFPATVCQEEARLHYQVARDVMGLED